MSDQNAVSSTAEAIPVSVLAIPAPTAEEIAAKAAVESAIREAEKTVANCVKIFSRGEKEYTKHLLYKLCPMIAHALRLYVKGNCTREFAVQILATEFGKAIREKMPESRVNAMVRVNGARELFDADGKVDVPYGHYDAAWSLLVEQNKAGEFSILPGIDVAARALFAELASSIPDKKELEERCAKLRLVSREYVQRERMLAAEKAKEQEEATAKAKRVAEAERVRLAAEAEKAAQVVVACPDDTEAKAALEAAEKAKADADRNAKETARLAQEASKLAVRTDNAVKLADVAVAKAEEKVDRKATAGAAGPVNVLKSASRATEKDGAKFAVDWIVGTANPSATMLETLRLAQTHDKLSHAVRTGLKEAIKVIAQCHAEEARIAEEKAAKKSAAA